MTQWECLILPKKELYSFPGAYSAVISMLYLKDQQVLKIVSSEHGILNQKKIFGVKNPEKSIKS